MRRLVTVVALALAVPMAAAQEPVLESDFQKFSYAMGYRLARDLMQQGVNEIDPGALAAGVREAMAGESFRFSPEEIRAAMTAYRESVVEKRTRLAVENKDAGDAFLAANAKRDGVRELGNGVQYEILTAGSGEKPAADAKVKVHYTGTLIDGTEFDSSRARGEPTELSIGDVIPGWKQALTEMPVGSRWMVWIPPEQAYGVRGAGAVIGPNETLVFDIELLEVLGD